MDIQTIIESPLLQVFLPATALPFVPVILLLVWLLYQYLPQAKKVAPALALALGLAVAFLFLQLPWRQAIPAGLTLGGYAIAAWELGKVPLLKGTAQEPPLK